MNRCKQCDRPIASYTVSGYCIHHKVQQRILRDRGIATQYCDGASVQQLSEEYGLCISWIRRILVENVHEVRPAPPRYLMADIVVLTADVFGVSVAKLTSKSKATKLVQARFSAALVARTRTNASLQQIGNALNRHHTTIVHSACRGKELFDADPIFRGKVKTVAERMKPVLDWKAEALRIRKPPAPPIPEPIAISAPKAKPKPVIEQEPELNDLDLLSHAVRQFYAAGRNCLEVY